MVALLAGPPAAFASRSSTSPLYPSLSSDVGAKSDSKSEAINCFWLVYWAAVKG